MENFTKPVTEIGNQYVSTGKVYTPPVRKASGGEKIPVAEFIVMDVNKNKTGSLVGQPSAKKSKKLINTEI